MTTRTLSIALLLLCTTLASHAQLHLQINRTSREINYGFDVPSGKVITIDAVGGLVLPNLALNVSKLAQSSATTGQVLTWNGTAWVPGTVAGTGDAMTSGTLAQFAATTSAELAGVISNETGTGALVFGTSPDFTTGITIGGVAVPTISSTSTLTNKTISLTSNTLTMTSAELATAVSNETGSGVLVFGTSPTLTTPTISGAVTFPDDVKQTFNPGTNNAGLNVGLIAGDVASPAEGDIWGNSSTATFRGRINGVTNTFMLTGFYDTSGELRTLVTDETGTGSLVFGTSPNFTTGITIGGVAVPTISSTSTLTNKTLGSGTAFADDVRMTFNPGTNNAGLNVGAHTVDPSSPIDGDVFYDSDDELLRAYINGAWLRLTGASSAFGTDNRVLRSDGTANAMQASAVTIDDSGNMSGVGTLSSGSITLTTTGTYNFATGVNLGPGGGLGAVIYGRGGAGSSNVSGNTSGSIDLRAGAAATAVNPEGAFGGQGGQIILTGGDGASDGGIDYPGGTSGSLTMSGADAVAGASGGDGGSINTSGATTGAGGSINTSAGAGGAGGSIDTSDGGGSIDTTAGGSITTGTGSLTGPNSSGTFALIDIANAWADGVKQTFNPNGTTAGINVGSHAGDPGTPANGDLWYDSTANELTARINGSNVALGAGGGGGLSSADIDTSAELAAIVTDETGSGALVFATSPTLVTPALGTPASGTLTNCTGLPQLAPWASSVSTTDVVSSSADTSLYSVSVPANTLGSSGELEFFLYCDYLNNTGANRTLTLTIKLGSTTLYTDTTTTIATSTGRRAMHLSGRLKNTATNAQVLSALFGYSSISTAPPTGTGPLDSDSPVHLMLVGTGAVDTTSTQTFDVRVQHNASDANLSVRCLAATVKLIKP